MSHWIYISFLLFSVDVFLPECFSFGNEFRAK